MNINLLTDATKHNLALMRISAFHKAHGDYVCLKGVGSFDLTYGSWLFDFSPKGVCDIEGGPGVDVQSKLPGPIMDVKPDYDLYGLDFSLGYTWAWCPRKCAFCIVPKQDNPRVHKSIWDFHDSRFKKICLLNNNTFSDPDWKETFEEIWDADLTVMDENGYDLRLLDDEKAEALKKTRFNKSAVYFSWDSMKDEPKILRGFDLLKKWKLNGHNTRIHVLVGMDTTEEEDLHRCQKIIDTGPAPFIMPYKVTEYTRLFKRFVSLHYYRKYPSIAAAWKDYKRSSGKKYIERETNEVFLIDPSYYEWGDGANNG